MTRTWDLWGNVIIAGTFALPLAFLAALALARRRERAGHPAPLRTALADVGIVAGTAPWVRMILTPGGGAEGVCLVPSRDLAELARAPWEAASMQVVGNPPAFAALGAPLPVRTARPASHLRVAAVAAAASALVEILRYAPRPGRFSSVDDVPLDTAGAVPAAAVTRRWWARRETDEPLPR